MHKKYDGLSLVVYFSASDCMSGEQTCQLPSVPVKHQMPLLSFAGFLHMFPGFSSMPSG